MLKLRLLQFYFFDAHNTFYIVLSPLDTVWHLDFLQTCYFMLSWVNTVLKWLLLGGILSRYLTSHLGHPSIGRCKEYW